jgi:hypothetical protein
MALFHPLTGRWKYRAVIPKISNVLPIYIVNACDFAGIDDRPVVAIAHPDRK